jgi:hypothetical protein
MTGMCPKCDHPIASVTMSDVRINPRMEARSPFPGIAYLCPSCNAVLGVGVDPDSNRRRPRTARRKTPAKKRAT